MIKKEVKEYSNRQRINLIKKDGFETGETVIIQTEQEYESIKSEVLELTSKLAEIEKENEILKNQENKLDEIIENITAPIYENHQKELEKAQVRADALNDELKQIHKIASQYAIDVNALNILESIFSHKKQNLTKNFLDSLYRIASDETISEVKKLD